MTQQLGAFQVGAVTYPLSTTSAMSSLFDCDPAVAYMLDFFSFIIQQHVEQRMLVEAVACSAPISAAVGQRYPYAPDPHHLLQNQYKFPLLAIGRTRGMTGRFTAGWEHDRTYFDLHYVFPPLSAGQSERLLPFLPAIYKAIRYKTLFGFDPAYTPPGGVLGQQPWGPTLANVERVGFGDPLREAEDVNYGGFADTGNLFFPALRMTGFVVERDERLPSAKFSGADITANNRGNDGTIVGPIAQQATQLAPTLTAVSPASGVVAGGTAITLTGTLFLPGPTPQQPWVTIGGAKATGVIFVNSTTLTCVTPAGAGTGAVDVVVTNADGQAVTLVGGFTYV